MRRYSPNCDSRPTPSRPASHQSQQMACDSCGVIPPRHVAFAGGYSAGHIYPAVAIFAQLRSTGVVGSFFGEPGGPERRLLDGSGIDFVPLESAAVANRPWFARLKSLARVLRALPVATRWLRVNRPDVLVALGSFASVAPSLAAWRLGIPVVTFEPNAVAGLASALTARFSREIWLSPLWNQSLSRQRRVRLIGVPLREEFRDEEEPVERAGTILVCGGSLGDGVLNRLVPGLLGACQDGRKPLRVVHLCGFNEEVEPVRQLYARVGMAAEVRGFVRNPSGLMRSTALAITSAGACALHEFAHLRVPVIVVPQVTVARQHQHLNALRFSKLTGLPQLRPEECRAAEWVSTISELLGTSRSRAFDSFNALGWSAGRAAESLRKYLRP